MIDILPDVIINRILDKVEAELIKEIENLEEKITDIDIHFRAHFKNDKLDLSNKVYKNHIQHNNSYDDCDLFNISENVINKYTLLHPKIDHSNTDFIFSNRLFKTYYHKYNGYFYKIYIDDNIKYILVCNKKIILSYEYNNDFNKYMYIYYDENRNLINGIYDIEGCFITGYYDINNNFITGMIDINGNFNSNLITTDRYDIDGNLIYDDDDDDDDDDE
jgi:hypothetical protein